MFYFFIIFVAVDVATCTYMEDFLVRFLFTAAGSNMYGLALNTSGITLIIHFANFVSFYNSFANDMYNCTGYHVTR